jgi:hypothetical protein
MPGPEKCKISCGRTAGSKTIPSKHWLHANDRNWPQSNCSVDLWIELLHYWGYDPVAAMAFTLTLDYEGDQFTFFKIPSGDLETLYGTKLLELSIYDDLEKHVLQQVRRGNVVLVESDGFYLPDTTGISYKSRHTKTTIGINAIDPEAGELTYFHNDVFGTLRGDDYAHVMYKTDRPVLFPYVEFVKQTGMVPASQQALKTIASGFLNRSVEQLIRTRLHPIAGFRGAFEGHVQQLSNATFHEFAFNHFRMLGSNFEFLGSFLSWLDLHSSAEHCVIIAEQAKALQFKTARMVARQRFDPCTDVFDRMELAYDSIVKSVRGN